MQLPLWAVWLLATLELLAPQTASAAPEPTTYRPLKLAVTSMFPRARSQAPQLIEIALQSEMPDLLQGRLEIQWYYGKRLVHSYLSPELALTTGIQRMRVAFPAIHINDDRIPVTGYPRFISERQTIVLPEVDLVAPVVWKRAFVAVEVQPREVGRHEAEKGIVDSISLEQFNPLRDAHFDMLTYPAVIAPEDLPATAPGYASFDLLVLEEEGFRQLKGAQLAAIGDWVEGGGSVVITPRGIMTAAHVNLLNRLAGIEASGNKAAPAYALDETGKLVIAAASDARKLVWYYSGLGRTVVVEQPLDPQVDFKTPEWRGIVAFLWKVRLGQGQNIVNRGFWDFPQTQKLAAWDGPGGMGPGGLFHPDPDGLAGSLRGFLLPSKIEGLPLPIVVLILTLFLLAIAPGDYFLLGYLNCRKYTWVLFACVSTFFTLATVKIAQSYMGQADFRTSLTVADLGESAPGQNRPRVLRTNRFELQFVAAQQVVETELRNSLFTDLSERAVGQERDDMQTRQFTVPQDEIAAGARAGAADLAMIEGNMPGAFKVRQQLRQWSPRLTRQTTFGDDPELAAEVNIDWSALKPETWDIESGRKGLQDMLLRNEPTARAILMHGAVAYGIAPRAEGSEEEIPIPARPTRQTSGTMEAAVENMSVRPQGRLFSVVSQISPTGSEILEDLAVLDESDPRQWLLIVVVRRENNWFAFRKTFRVNN